MAIKKCIHCANDLEEITDFHTEFVDNICVFITNIPMFFCENCLDAYYPPDVSDRIIDIIESIDIGSVNSNIIFKDYRIDIQ